MPKIPTLGRLVMTNDTTKLIYCDWCKWGGDINGVAPTQYKSEKWTAIHNVDITVSAEDKKNSALYIISHLKKLKNDDELDMYWKLATKHLSECYNEEDIHILTEYYKTNDITKLKFKNSVQKGTADICPNCIEEVHKEFPQYF